MTTEPDPLEYEFTDEDRADQLRMYTVLARMINLRQRVDEAFASYIDGLGDIGEWQLYTEMTDEEIDTDFRTFLEFDTETRKDQK